ncbi:hypothetical protein BJY00DRAFT_277691 [Aspergillus carlsbadensis]|nr:hypothetical protein BJY00DRAFT_277691 [Aspergillus carlsbadensis]
MTLPRKSYSRFLLGLIIMLALSLAQSRRCPVNICSPLISSPCLHPEPLRENACFAAEMRSH